MCESRDSAAASAGRSACARACCVCGLCARLLAGLLPGLPAWLPAAVGPGCYSEYAAGPPLFLYYRCSHRLPPGAAAPRLPNAARPRRPPRDHR
jgi:hypothetical protein